MTTKVATRPGRASLILGEYLRSISPEGKCHNKSTILSPASRARSCRLRSPTPLRVSIPQNNGYKIIGDACGEIQLAHYAIQQAKYIATGIPYNKTLIPSVIYGTPEIAWVGLREQDCDSTFTSKILPVTALGKAWCDDAIDGFIKLIIKNNKIYGAHIVSKEASSLIHIVLTAMQNSINADKLKEQCFAHPTYAEGIFDLLMQM